MFLYEPRTDLIAAQLTEGQATAIGLWWQARASSSDKHVALQTIKEAHEGGFWLACACTSLDRARPILAPVLSANSYSLRRLPKRLAHAVSCVFFSEQNQDSGSLVDADVTMALQPGAAPNFDLPKAGELVERTNLIQRGPRAQQQIPMMARRLWWLADRSGWQKMPRELHRSDIGAAITGIKTLSDSGRPILFFATTRAWSEGWMTSALERHDGTRVDVVWWLIQLASIDRDRRVIEVVNSTLGRNLLIQVRGEIQVWAGDVAEVCFPMAALAAVRMEEGVLHIDHLYAQPVAARDNWMLLESHQQRETLSQLARACDWLGRQKNTVVTVAKPLFAWHGHAKPDFVLATQTGRYLAVETVLSDDSAPRGRRAVLFEKAEVIWHKPGDQQPSGTHSDIAGDIARWALRPPA